jgi:hypothetical protein
MKKYIETFFYPFRFDALGNVKNADSSQLDKFIDDLAGFPSPKSTFIIDNFGNTPKFINLPPFFNNTLVVDKFRMPGSNVLVDYVYLHPEFTFFKNFTQKSSLQDILTTSSFRPFQTKPNFFETQINMASSDSDRVTTGRFFSGFINKIFFTPPPPPAIIPTKLNASILADQAYLRAIATSINNSPFTIATFDEFFYLLSGFDKTSPYQFSQYQISNFDYYKTLLKLNYIFHSHRQFTSVNRSDLKVSPVYLWYENLFLSHLSHLLDFYYFSQIRPEYRAKLKHAFSIDKTKYSNFFSTEFYPNYVLPKSFKNSFQLISSPLYSGPSNNFDTVYQKKLPVFFDFPLTNSKETPNLFKLNFSEVFFYSWDFKSNRFVDSRTQFKKVINHIETKKFRRYKELPSDMHKTNLEGDDLDRFFFSAYKKAKTSNPTALPDSSTLLYETLRWSTFESPNFSIYKNFTAIQSDFLNTFEFYLPYSKNAESQIFNFNVRNHSFSASATFLRRYQHPFNSVSVRPNLRSIFQPSPRYKRFISFRNKFRKNQHYPYGRRKKSSLIKDQTFVRNQNDFYFYFFDPTISFNKEYSSYFLPKKSFKIAHSNFFDYVYSRRRLPFRKKYKLFDRSEKKDFIFKSRIRSHKTSSPSQHVRLRTRKINRYRHHKTDLIKKEEEHNDHIKYKDSTIDVGPLWDASYNWYYPFRILSLTAQGIVVGLIGAPYRFLTSLILTVDGFFTSTAYYLIFFFFDYMLLTIYVYFPGLLFFFDYAFFSFHFHVFHFWIIFFSFILVIVGAYLLLTSSDFPKKFTFFQFFPFVFFYFSIEVFFTFLGVIFLTFTTVENKVFKFIFFLLFTFIFMFFGVNFFINFFLSFSRYNYIPLPHFFFPYPTWTQRFGSYKTNYYFQTWPIRFLFFKLYPLLNSHHQKQKKDKFKKSFFFTYVGDIIKRSFYHKKTFQYVYDLKNLDFPVPIFGPNVFSSYSYYQDKINQVPLRASPWDSTQDETVLENESEYQAPNLNDESEFREVTYQPYNWPSKFSILVNDDDEEDLVLDADQDPLLEDNNYYYDTDRAVDLSEIHGPTLPTRDLDHTDDASFFGGKVNQAFFKKQKKPFPVSDVFMDDELEDIFDYDSASQFEIYERDTLDQTFTTENSLGYWYSFHISKSNKRVLPPTFTNLHSRPLDPLFTTNLLFPFLISLKSYSDFENFPQFKLSSILKFFKIFKISISTPYTYKSFWAIAFVVSILFFPIKVFFSFFSFFKIFSKKKYFFKIFSKKKYSYFYYEFRKAFQFNIRFNISFSAFLTYFFFFIFFSILEMFVPSKFSKVIKQFSKSFMFFYLFKNLKFLNHLVIVYPLTPPKI